MRRSACRSGGSARELKRSRSRPGGARAELGSETARWHALAGRQAGALGVDLLVAVGSGARGYLDGATGRTDCLWFPDLDSTIRPLRSLLRPDDVVLLKGSRTAALERLADALGP